jgi:phenylpropionate dioxygenase-like ring-hydroxylating dioxygenase large terminal subunit
MQHAEQIAVAKRLLNFIDTTTTALCDAPYAQAVVEYTSLEIAAREQQVFFREQPLCVGLSDDLAAPGTYRTHDLSGAPLLLVRDLHGEFTAFLNVCRHRGARVAKDCGEARGFTCPYHAWVYGLDGTLVNRPDEASFAALARADFGLTRLPATERHGLLWVCPTPERDFVIEHWLGKLDSELASYGLAGFKHYASRDITRKMNWKLVVDTFLESYHFGVLHRDSISSIFHHNLATFDAYGKHFRLVSPRKTIANLPPANEAEWKLLPHVVVIYVLFPSTVLVWQGEQIELWQIFPGATPDESHFRVTLYSPEPALTEKARRHWDRNLELVLHVVENEDFPVGEGIQQGFVSAAQTHTVFGRNEPALAHYHREITLALR